MPGRSCPCLLVLGDPARLGRSAHMTPPAAAAAHTCQQRSVLKVRVSGRVGTTHAFKTNNKKHPVKVDFPLLHVCFLIGLRKIITPWRCTKISKKKVLKFF